MSEFVEFQKIPRLSRECVITEKIDGTNAQIQIVPDIDLPVSSFRPEDVIARSVERGLTMFAGSRNRYITPQADNFGFAAWVREHAEALWGLGEGRHFGEWWGHGIQRGYGLPKGERRFSLFNVARWHQAGQPAFESRSLNPTLPLTYSAEAPACCHVVPVLYRGEFATDWADRALEWLERDGSYAAPGFSKPEGIVIYHTAAGSYFKKTLEKDAEPKGRAA